MATAFVSLPADTDSTVVAAVANRIIRLHRILVSPGSSVKIKSGVTEICPTLKASANDNINVAWSDSPLACARGNALVVRNTSLGSATAWVEYDVVA